MLTTRHWDIDRRYSRRWPCGKEIVYRPRRGRRLRQGCIVERSLNGLVLVAPTGDGVEVGTHLVPGSRETGERHGFREGVVRRTRWLAGARQVLFVEILA